MPGPPVSSLHKKKRTDGLPAGRVIGGHYDDVASRRNSSARPADRHSAASREDGCAWNTNGMFQYDQYHPSMQTPRDHDEMMGEKNENAANHATSLAFGGNLIASSARMKCDLLPRLPLHKAHDRIVGELKARHSARLAQ